MLHTDVGIRRGLQGLKLEGPWTLAARVEDSTPRVAWERERCERRTVVVDDLPSEDEAGLSSDQQKTATV